MPETSDAQPQAQSSASAVLQARFEQAMALHQQRKLADAERIYREVLREQPNHFAALHLLGVIALQTGHPEQAVELIGKAIELKPDYAEAHYNHGLALKDLKRPEDALASYEKAIELKPDYAEAYSNRGVALQNLKRPQDALASYDKAIAIKPNFSRAYFNRGNVLQDLERPEDALASYDKAIESNPGDAETHINRGNALLKLRRPEDALASFGMAIALNPDFAEAYNNRGRALNELDRLEQALASFDKAIALKPNLLEGHINRGDVLRNLKRPEEAIHCFRRAIALKPDHEFLCGALMYTKMISCDWSNFDTEIDHHLQAIGRGEKVTMPFPLLAITNSPELQKKASGIYASAKHPRNNALPKIAMRHGHRKIRIGYFSADFRNHPGAYSMVEMFERHDRSRFEIIGFSFSPDDSYELKSRLESAFDKFVDVRSWHDLDVTKMARNMEIDIAIDRNGFTTYGRPNIFALRAAPLQVSYKAFPGTMGTDYIDYLIADSVVIPTEHRRHYSEKIAYLPNTYQVYDSKRSIPDRTVTRKALGLPQEGFVFCCFNNNYKITPVVFDSWMRILKKVDGSVLWLLEDNAAATANLRRGAGARGINPNRLVSANRLPVSDHLARHRFADLFLDTLPYNAHTTANDALWAGVPVLTCLGETFAGRVAASLLNAIDLPELVTTTLEAYEQMAIDLATQPQKLANLKRKLADNRLTTPLFDTKLYTKHIEAAYTAMYERYQAGLPPDHIIIPN